MTVRQLLKLSERNQFSNYLPYLAYDDERELYYNQDDTFGYILEIPPISFMGTDTVNMLKSLYSVVPDESVFQFILFADPYIDFILEAYKNLKTRQDEFSLIKEATERYSHFLKEGSEKGIDRLAGIPVRYFRSFLTVKMSKYRLKGYDLKGIKHNIIEILHGAGLPPSNVSANELLNFLRRIFNDRLLLDRGWNENKPLNKQIILAESEIYTSLSEIRVGKKIYRCITPKLFPKKLSPFIANQLIGGVWGVASDAEQITKPFIFTLNIYKDDGKIKQDITTKANIVFQQQGFGSLAPSLARRKEEFVWAIDEMDNNTRFLKVLPIIWTYTYNRDEAQKTIARIKRIWESKGFTMQEDKGILPILFISSLPFGLYTEANNINRIDRDFIVQDGLASTLAPVQADFHGGGKPILMFVGRKGQLVSMDIFDKHSDNYNALVAASTGSGKSFLVNFIVFNHFSAGDKIRIIDIGGSYRKLVHIFNGRYLEFTPESNINLNPFTHIEDIDNETAVLAAILKQMVLSSTGQIAVEIAETADTIIKDAIRIAYELEGNNASIDTVFNVLQNYDRFVGDVPNRQHFIDTASFLAFNLKDFTSKGTYGRWFNGRSTFNISEDEFVVLELEHLKPQKELFKVITLQIINNVTRDLYLSDRNRRKLIIFDEAWQFLEGSDIFADVIEEGYRRARKYNGSFSIVVQSLLDLKNFGRVGDVIRGNSAWKFMLSSPDFEKAKAEKIIDYDEFVMRVLKTVKSNKPKYSEIFIDSSAFGIGVVRLVVDDYTYFIFTSDPKEIAEIEQIVKEKGVDYSEAIHEMVKRYRQGG